MARALRMRVCWGHVVLGAGVECWAAEKGLVSSHEGGKWGVGIDLRPGVFSAEWRKNT